MSSLIKISQLLLVISQQTLGFEQTLGKNHFGHITFDQDMPVINKWITCHPDCSSKNNISLEMNNEIKPFLEILDSRGNTYENYLVSSHGEGHELEVHYRSRNSSNEISQIIFRSDIENRFLETIIQSNNEVILKFDLQNHLSEEDIYGLGGIYNGTWLVRHFWEMVDDQGSEKISNLRKIDIKEGSWVGARTRFWTFLISPKNNNLLINEINELESRFQLTSSAEDGLHQIRFYFGPVNTELNRQDPELRELIYSALWDWLRQLCFLIEWIFIWLLGLVGNEGLAILLLACALKVLIYPLNRIAEKWQDDVNATQSVLQPQIDQIKNLFSGEEANHRIMQLYKEKNISPFYSIKSLFGFLIQIPIFIAVFDVLGESIYLLEKSFFFINDLSKPDQWANLPLFIPFFGDSLNLLPFCMMIISMLSAYLYTDKSLNKDLLSSQKRKLYLMSILFFALLFTFPSGMVLYWTASNFLQLAQMQIKKALQ